MRLPFLLLVFAVAAPSQDKPLVFDLNEAILKDDAVAVEGMLRDGVDVNGRDLDGRTALTVAAFHRKCDIVRTLLRAKASPTLRGLSGMTPIAAAASGGDPLTLKLILESVDDPMLVRGALLVAASQGHLDIVRMLLESGADPGRTPETATPVFFAAKAGFVAVLELLLQHGGHPGATDDKGQTAVFAAVAEGRSEVLPLLLSRGADPQAGDPANKLTPLFLAVMGGRSECARTLIAYGADVDFTNEEGSRAIHLAAGGPRPTMFDLLASFSADVDAPDADGATPLMLAVATGRAENVRRLLAARADKSIANNDGVTPLEQARKMEREDLVELLK